MRMYLSWRLPFCCPFVAPNIILLLFPKYAASQDNTLMLLGQTLAAGGLLGDVFLHTLPDAIEEAAHHLQQHPNATADELNTAGVLMLAGFVIFLTADLLMRSLQGSGGGGGSGSHQQQHHNESNKQQQHSTTTTAIKTSTILLNLAADALHNFTDGLAIGTGYALQKHNPDASLVFLLFGRGGLATMSILFHEIPHELGDFCVLIRAGYSKQQAVMAQFTTAIAAFIGTLVALYFSQFAGAGEGLGFITAGGFVYLAAVTILPDALEQSEHKSSSAWFRFTQLLSFCVGIGFMYAVTFLEEDHHNEGHDHNDDTAQDSVQIPDSSIANEL
jgi:solute carrier family 39 (zinc transporter), member 7